MDDVLQGQGVYTYEDGGVLYGTYVDGELNGPAQEFDPEGRLIFKGQYKDNIHYGICWIYYPVRFTVCSCNPCRASVLSRSYLSGLTVYNQTVVVCRTEAAWWARSTRTGR